MAENDEIRLYPSRWSGQVLLVCRKCQKKLKRSGEHPHARKLGKSLKKLAEGDPLPVAIHVLPVSCMKLCPKGGVTVCTQAQLRHSPPGLSIIRTVEDAAALYRLCREEAAGAMPVA